MSIERKVRSRRGDYRHFRPIPTRWMDDDPYGHVNNVVYYSWFDTAVNTYPIEAGVLDIAASPTVGVVIETGCTYFESVSYPETVEAGLAVTKLGRTSVTYGVGVFKPGGRVCGRAGPLRPCLCGSRRAAPDRHPRRGPRQARSPHAGASGRLTMVSAAAVPQAQPPPLRLNPLSRPRLLVDGSDAPA